MEYLISQRIGYNYFSQIVFYSKKNDGYSYFNYCNSLRVVHSIKFDSFQCDQIKINSASCEFYMDRPFTTVTRKIRPKCKKEVNYIFDSDIIIKNIYLMIKIIFRIKTAYRYRKRIAFYESLINRLPDELIDMIWNYS